MHAISPACSRPDPAFAGDCFPEHDAGQTALPYRTAFPTTRVAEPEDNHPRLPRHRRHAIRGPASSENSTDSRPLSTHRHHPASSAHHWSIDETMDSTATGQPRIPPASTEPPMN